MIQNSDVLIVIPARLESQRLSRKLLRKIGGRTIISHVCHQVSQCFNLADFIVATDSQLLFNHVEHEGFKVEMTDTRHTCGTERCAEISHRYPDYKWIINVQGDEPMISPSVISDMILALISEPSIDIISLYTHIEDERIYAEPSSVKVTIETNGMAKDFSRHIDLNTTAGLPIGVYGFKADILKQLVTLEPSTVEIERKLEQMRWIENGYRLNMLYTSNPSISIDTNEDLIEARRIFKKSKTALH